MMTASLLALPTIDSQMHPACKPKATKAAPNAAASNNTNNPPNSDVNEAVVAFAKRLADDKAKAKLEATRVKIMPAAPADQNELACTQWQWHDQ